LAKKVGFGCRSVTVLTHLVSQLMLITSWLIDPDEPEKHPKLRTINWGFICFAMFGGITAALGGTIMQLVGVYRNCVCKAGLRYWLNPANGIVELALDTQSDRDSWIVWWWNGISALGFFSCVLIFACFYNMWMMENCKTIIDHDKFSSPCKATAIQRSQRLTGGGLTYLQPETMPIFGGAREMRSWAST
jgi:hypothetical protein